MVLMPCPIPGHAMVLTPCPIPGHARLGAGYLFAMRFCLAEETTLHGRSMLIYALLGNKHMNLCK